MVPEAQQMGEIKYVEKGYLRAVEVEVDDGFGGGEASGGFVPQPQHG